MTLCHKLRALILLASYRLCSGSAARVRAWNGVEREGALREVRQSFSFYFGMIDSIDVPRADGNGIAPARTIRPAAGVAHEVA